MGGLYPPSYGRQPKQRNEHFKLLNNLKLEPLETVVVRSKAENAAAQTGCPMRVGRRSHRMLGHGTRDQQLRKSCTDSRISGLGMGRGIRRRINTSIWLGRRCQVY